MDFNKMYEIIKNNKVIPKELTDALLEYDVLNSVATQAALNKVLLEIRAKLETELDSSVEILSKDGLATTAEEFDNWIYNEFTNYSYDMYKNSLDK
jgi:hypothetical protein